MGNPVQSTSTSEIEQLKAAVVVLRKIVEENNRNLRHLEEKTRDIVLAFESAKGAFKVLEFIGMLAKPIFLLISVSATVYGLFTYAKTVFK